MATNTRKPSSTDANREVPEHLTQLFIQGIQSLTPSPRTEYLQDVFLEKFVSNDTDPSEVRRTRAIAKWLATERNNEATNVRLITTPAEYNILPRVTYQSFMDKARQMVISIIGETPSDDDLFGSFSGGATTSRKRTESHPASKYLGKADITERASSYFSDILSEIPVWHQLRDGDPLVTVRGNVLFTVPKTTLIDRCACKEPDINMFIQKGLGAGIRRGLRRVGIDLNDQTRNQALARQGSMDGSLATLDLSSASDSVSIELVRELLPLIWFVTLDAVRSPITVIDGDEHVNEMFSSMGNGFTFELESLLFYVLARTTAYFRGVSGVISVYGDDIIVPSQVSQDLMWVLGYCGFEVNTSKSFWTGSFRESCGGHFINGLDVTPFYLRNPILRLTDLIHACNALRGWGSVYNGIVDPEIWPLWSDLASYVPKSLWGGRDHTSKFQLVSPDVPKAVLQPERVKRLTGPGGYVHWLNATWRRDFASDGLTTSEYFDTRSKYRPVKARRTVARLTDLFIEEIHVMPRAA